MKKHLFFASILCIILSANNATIAQYSNATLNGPWFLDSIPLQIYNPDNTNYMVFDGNGNVTDCNFFCTPFSGTYSVTTGGAVTGMLCGIATFSGQLSSQNSGNITTIMGTNCNFVLSRITNPGALTDSLVGLLYTASCGQRNVVFRLNSQGQIVSSSGLTLPVTGGVYADSGHFEGHVRSGESSGWDEFTFLGAYANDSLTGSIGLDQTGCNGTVYLKRFGVATGIVPVAAQAPKLIIYPNPANDVVNLNINKENVELNIYSVIGVLIRTEMLKQNHQQINIGDLKTGIYLIEIKSKDSTENQRLIIQR